MKRAYDLVIAGSGFAGSLMAMIARRLGYSVALIERGTHPRTVIGESSTPLANLLLEELCQRYDLPAIAPLSKWGSWQRAYPKIACGLKRGFTFYHHDLGDSRDPRTSIDSQLLVAASPHDEIADTHWYRADFDTFFVEQARLLGVDYFDKTEVQALGLDSDGADFNCIRSGHEFTLRAKFVIDATGPRGLLHYKLNLRTEQFENYPKTQALWSHFEDVSQPTESPLGSPPYPAEDAAVHHIFDGGWIWVLRFNNGIASAGIAATDEVAARLRFNDGESAWYRLLTELPSLRSQFEHARAVQPLRAIPRLSFLSQRVVGTRWALLPSAAGFVDPLLSTGFPLTLLGIERMSAILQDGLDQAHLGNQLAIYEQKTKSELSATADLISALYANMKRFSLFRELSLLYFAAASFSEAARRLDKKHLAQSFLLCDDPTFGPAMHSIVDRARNCNDEDEATDIAEEIQRAVAPIDVAGLGKRHANNWYPVEADDLLNTCAKVQSTREEVEALLHRSGFFTSMNSR